MITNSLPIGVNVAWSFGAAVLFFVTWKYAWQARLGSLRFGWKVSCAIILGAWVFLFVMFSMAPVEV